MKKDTWKELKTQRDELRIQVHLFNMETKEKWNELDKKFQKLNSTF